MGTMVNRRRYMGEKEVDTNIAVDLGLPSGTLWCDRNVGANEISDYGLYFSWGNIDGHEVNSGYNFDDNTYATTEGSQLTTIPLSHDAANIHMKGKWHIPTTADFSELTEYTTNKWQKINNIGGKLFTSKINGNSIFLPSTALLNGTSVGGYGGLGQEYGSGYYPSSTPLSANYKSYCSALSFYGNVVYTHMYQRKSYGFAIRAVKNN